MNDVISVHSSGTMTIVDQMISTVCADMLNARSPPEALCARAVRSGAGVGVADSACVEVLIAPPLAGRHR